MRHLKIKRAAAMVVLVAVAAFVAFGHVDNAPPTEQQKEFAVQTADLLQKEVFAALLQEFGETTPENVEQGKQAISLVFHDANRDMRLIGNAAPLLGGNNNIPADEFEQESLALALQGKPNTTVERHGNRWYYRRSIALSNSFHTSCALCHSNFTPQFFQETNNPGQWVGALMLRVPVKEN
ncbi:MAG: hypothetical protein QOG00_949 [Pyrinomonadaceae bacterium]|jgi:hypothetical protein|nr:hypothetical protein [Pyrinomonadaceae bacterium]MDQ1593099.1 hypothetical protein [Pyrinomonadaceae bacterium]MDQ1611018.1 hypothetical protein [Pyrinomonadaceae bacterium]MDX6272699.1 hypothetical protein [Acidobacteriota bacterium]